MNQLNGLLLRAGMICGSCFHVNESTPQSGIPTESSVVEDVSGIIAFVDVNVVTMTDERILAKQTVIVRNGKIVAMGAANQVTIPDSAYRINGKEKSLQQYLPPDIFCSSF